MHRDRIEGISAIHVKYNSRENTVESRGMAIYSYPNLKLRMIMVVQTLQTRGSHISHIL